MNRIIYSLAGFATLALFSACNNESTTSSETDTTTTTSVDTMQNQTMMAGPLSADDSTFVMKAAKGGLMEVQAGTLAQQQAQDERVKNFGSMMVRDHSQANEELRSLVGAQVTFPDSLDKKDSDHLEAMRKMEGKSFDNHYMSMMTEDHDKDVKEFEEAQNKVQDPALKNWIAKTLPVLKVHQDSAKAISGKQ